LRLEHKACDHNLEALRKMKDKAYEALRLKHETCDRNLEALRKKKDREYEVLRLKHEDCGGKIEALCKKKDKEFDLSSVVADKQIAKAGEKLAAVEAEFAALQVLHADCDPTHDTLRDLKAPPPAPGLGLLLAWI
jgi:hypothetical protein